MKRITPFQCVIENKFNLPVNLFANQEVKVENVAIEELITFLQVQHTLDNIQQADPDFFGTQEVSIERIALTPDFHKGAGIPIGTTIATKGFVLPQAIGKDINCGMRLYITDLNEGQIRANLEALTKKIRHVYFQGGRNLPISPHQRKALLQYGLTGLLETWRDTQNMGLWKLYDAVRQEKELTAVIDQGSLATETIFSGLENYANIDYLSYDGQLGSIGGGNHFVEIQKIESILDGATAYAWGLKKDAIVVMIHTGSVSIGYPTAVGFQKLLLEMYPKGLKKPENGIYLLPVGEKYEQYTKDVFTGLYNAANFAFANRLFLGLMMQHVFGEFFKNTDFRLLYDSGHNMLWQDEQDPTLFLHRKGACSARGPEQMVQAPYHWTGEPVLIPGSMGASSFIMAGCGNKESNYSASHGAGRSLSRGESLKYDEHAFKAFLEQFHIITPIDPNSAEIRGRQDIMQKWHDELKKEAPFAFKPVKPIIDTQVESTMVKLVAEAKPILTVKG